MIKITALQIDYETLENIIVTAFEGGSNYWLDLRREEFDDKLVKYPNLSFSERVAKSIWEDTSLVINVYDVEDEDGESIGSFCLEDFNQAFVKASEEFPYALSAFVSEDYDAADADIIFQLAALKEVVYG